MELNDIRVKNAKDETIFVNVNGTSINDLESGAIEHLFLFTNIQAIKNKENELEQKIKEIEKQKSMFDSLNKQMVDRDIYVQIKNRK